MYQQIFQIKREAKTVSHNHGLNLIFMQAKMDATPAAATAGTKPPTAIPTAAQPTKIATPPLTGIGRSKFCYYCT